MVTLYIKHKNGHGIKGCVISSPSLKLYCCYRLISMHIHFIWHDKYSGFKTKYVRKLFFILQK
jgi:hypothetical protein